MGAIKKDVRANIRLAARILIVNYMRKHEVKWSKSEVKALVKEIETNAMPGLMKEIHEMV